MDQPGGGCSGPCVPSLADIAYAFWATDLRPDLDNNVPRYVPDRTVGVTGPVVPIPPVATANPEIF